MPIFTVGAAGTTSDSGFNVANSAMLETNGDFYRTPLSEGNRKKFTISIWVKLHRAATATQNIINAQVDGSNYAVLRYENYNFEWIAYAGSQVSYLRTTGLFRDTSAWYHIVIASDTDQGTAANRTKMYINGSQVTDFQTENYPGSAAEYKWNDDVVHSIGAFRYASTTNNFLHAYVAEVVNIDGQQLTPTSFGEVDSDSGIWKPINVSGLTFGTNGFYLDFENATNNHNITVVGDAKHSTTQNKIGATSIAFDGTGDRLDITNSDLMESAEGTIEAWVYMNAFESGSTDYYHPPIYHKGNIYQNLSVNSSGTVISYLYTGSPNALSSNVNISTGAWNHLAVTWNSSGRKIWINGVERGSSSTSLSAMDSGGNNATFHMGWGTNTSSTKALNGYVDELRVSTTVRYTGSFTPYTSALTRDSNTTLLVHSDTINNSTAFFDGSGELSLGADKSGTGNHFTKNNITLINQSTDTPTNNFCTLNPLSIGPRNNGADSSGNLSFGNTKCSFNGSGDDFGSTMAVSTGKWYYEVKLITAQNHGSGFVDVDHFTDGDYDASNGGIVNGNGFVGSAEYSSGSQYILNGTATSSAATFADNDIVGYAFDVDAGEMKIYQNGTLRDTITGIPTGVTYMPIIGDDSSTDAAFECNFGGVSAYTISSGNTDGKYGNFEYAPPAGYYALCTKRLAEFG